MVGWLITGNTRLKRSCGLCGGIYSLIMNILENGANVWQLNLITVGFDVMLGSFFLWVYKVVSK